MTRPIAAATKPPSPSRSRRARAITTGISAADRARTVAVAIDSANGPKRSSRRATSFRLVARPGGVLVRAGHTEAAVDVARLAGLNPSGVICEIMREDGTMARLDDLMDFARTHDLKIGTIRDLIAYRLQKDHMVERGRLDRLHLGQRRAVAGTGLPRQGDRRRAARDCPRRDRTGTSRCWCGCTASTCSPMCSAKQRARSGLLPRRDGDDRGAWRRCRRRTPRRLARIAVAGDRLALRQGRRDWRGAARAMASARRSLPRSASTR